MGLNDALRELVLPKLDRVQKTADGFMARCPAHEDRNPSLSLGYGTKHPVIFKCHAGCDAEDILKALGLTWEELSAPREERKGAYRGKSTMIATYDYVDEDGKLLYQVCRFEPKKFLQRRPLPGGDWEFKLGNTRRVLYRLPAVIEAVKAGRQVWVVEGEKDVHAVEERLGLPATCNSGGAGMGWPDSAFEMFRDASVAIWSDADKEGRAHARKVMASLAAVGAEVTVYESPTHKDAADHLGAGFGLEELVETRATTEEPTPVLAPDLWEFIAAGDDAYDWLVPDVLERGDRLMITGAEGLGKSVWCRQLCVQLAAGIHPFQPGTVDPVKVLVVDCENSMRQNRRHYGTLAGLSVSKGRRVPDGGLRLIHRPEGIDLTKGDDAEWLLERVRAHRPDVLYIGPFYRLHASDINDESAARKTVSVLDAARVAGDGCVLLMEAHAGHGQHGSQRALRPVGSSLLLRWPEFGFGLRRAKECLPNEQRPRLVDLEAWRGARDERDWPSSFRHGKTGEWPWMPEAAVKPEWSSASQWSAESLSERGVA
ncbi:ATP-binding protein [Glycomyces tenuis]|uniref:ATP-binding protein n=1 Tax=Glycomyces tenuis TaxID=58116 RepID=UPI000422C85E|nr:AAA family ATPase [Glycomyces tenuis]